jgi:Phage tail lysozyme
VRKAASLMMATLMMFSMIFVAVQLIGDSPAGAVFPNDQTAFDYFVQQGLTTVQAAAIVGNFDQESGDSPTSVQSGGPGRGIAQWGTGGRWDTSVNDNVLWYAALQGESPWSLSAQLQFTWYELTNIGYGYSALQGATTIDSATVIFQNDFEKCGACDTSNRESYAQAVYNAYASSPPPVPTGLAISSVTATSDTLTWNPSAGATNYYLERWFASSGTCPSGGTYANGVCTNLWSTSDQNTFTNEDLVANGVYDYAVEAVNTFGDSAFSATLTVYTPSATPPTVQTSYFDAGGSAGLSYCSVAPSGFTGCNGSGHTVVYESPITSTVLANGTSVVFFDGANGGLSECTVSSTGSWAPGCGSSNWSVVAGTPIVSPATSSGDATVYFDSTNGSGGLSECTVSSNGAWVSCQATGWGLVSGTSLSASSMSNGATTGFFNSPSGGMSECTVSSTGVWAPGCGDTGWGFVSGEQEISSSAVGGIATAYFYSGLSGKGFSECTVSSSGAWTDCDGSGWSITSGTPITSSSASGATTAYFDSASNGLAECTASSAGVWKGCGGSNWVPVSGSPIISSSQSNGATTAFFNTSAGGLTECTVSSAGAWAPGCNESGWAVVPSSAMSSSGVSGAATAYFNSTTGSGGLSECTVSTNGELVNCEGSGWPIVSGTSVSSSQLSTSSTAGFFDGAAAGTGFSTCFVSTAGTWDPGCTESGWSVQT